jgi:pimeloyl-ACP methyl ester carboxylesterase
VFAIDWLGHGLSDKPLQASIISFELHMQTLFKFFDHYQIGNAVVAAHDWGG